MSLHHTGWVFPLLNRVLDHLYFILEALKVVIVLIAEVPLVNELPQAFRLKIVNLFVVHLIFIR